MKLDNNQYWMKIKFKFLLIATFIYNDKKHFIQIYTFIYLIINRFVLVNGELGRKDDARLNIGGYICNCFIIRIQVCN